MDSHTPVTRHLLCLTTLLVVAACSSVGDDASASVAARSDSAGIEIVRNSAAGVWGAESRWRFEEDLRIGGLSAPVEAQFGAVPPTGVAVGADGTIFVLDGQAREVRAFSADGSYLRTIGGAGQGPGEFGAALAALAVGPAGRLLVPDLMNQSIHRFEPDGTYLDSPRMVVAGAGIGSFLPVRWDRLSDGRMVAQVRSFSLGGLGRGRGRGGETPIMGMSEVDALVALDEDGVPSDTVLTMRTGESLSGLGQGLPRMTLFAPEPLWTATRSGEIVTARTNAYQLTVHDEEGTVVRIIERDVPARLITEAEKEDLMEAIMAAATEALPQGLPLPFGSIEDMISFADSYPLMVQLLAGPEGTLWVEGYPSAGGCGGGRYRPADRPPAARRHRFGRVRQRRDLSRRSGDAGALSASALRWRRTLRYPTRRAGHPVGRAAQVGAGVTPAQRVRRFRVVPNTPTGGPAPAPCIPGDPETTPTRSPGAPRTPSPARVPFGNVALGEPVPAALTIVAAPSTRNR